MEAEVVVAKWAADTGGKAGAAAADTDAVTAAAASATGTVLPVVVVVLVVLVAPPSLPSSNGVSEAATAATFCTGATTATTTGSAILTGRLKPPTGRFLASRALSSSALAEITPGSKKRNSRKAPLRLGATSPPPLGVWWQRR